MQPEMPRWQEERGLGSAEYFGQYLKALREYKGGSDPVAWASTAGIEPERYRQFETGAIPIPPSVEEVNDWSARWNLTRDEIIDLKISGGHDISAYLGELTAEDVRGAMQALAEEQPRFLLVRVAWEMAKGFISSTFNKKP